MKIERKRDVDSVIVRVVCRLDDAKTGTVVGTKVVDYVKERVGQFELSLG